SGSVLARYVTRLDMNLGDPAVIPLDETVQNLGEKPLLLPADTPCNAEIDRDDRAVGLDKQIAGMHVSMKETVTQRLAKEVLDQRRRKVSQIMTGRTKPFDV